MRVGIVDETPTGVEDGEEKSAISELACKEESHEEPVEGVSVMLWLRRTLPFDRIPFLPIC